MFRYAQRRWSGRELSLSSFPPLISLMVFHPFSPTCGQQFRRHWQAFTLSVRFSIFRAQKKIRRKLNA